MKQPSTRLDVRFSEPDASPTSWDITQAALEASELFMVTTVRANGRPHVTPLVAVWLDGALLFSAGSDEQKSVNLRTNAHVILSTGSSEWASGLDIVVEGEARRVLDRETLERAAQVWIQKWDGAWNYEVVEGGFRHPGDDADPVEMIYVFKVDITKVLAFSKGPYSHTTHRFQ
jgi:general stress protein 26